MRWPAVVTALAVLLAAPACQGDDPEPVTPDDIRVLVVQFESGVAEPDVRRLVAQCKTGERTEVRIDAAPDLLIRRPADGDYQCFDKQPGVERVYIAG